MYPGKLTSEITASQCRDWILTMAQKKVYFCGSIRAGRQDADLYKSIIQKIDGHGMKVLTEFVGWEREAMLGKN